jgi:hypothetical protein
MQTTHAPAARRVVVACATFATLAAWLAAGPPARADEVLLTNGNTLEGKARREGDDVVLTTRHGEHRLKAADVVRITPGPTQGDRYQERLRALDPGSGDPVPDLVALADWCQAEGLRAEARLHWRAVLAQDPDHGTARARLGYVRYQGRWLTEPEYYAERGFVRRGGQWVSREEARREDAERIAAAARAEHERTVRLSLGKLASMKRRTRLEGRVALQQYAERIGDPRLAAFATEVAEYYNAAWAHVRTQLEARVLTEVRATQTTLKRPVPTLTTSLGAGSAPVTIQLPELRVVRVQTTVLLPAQIELDEE